MTARDVKCVAIGLALGGLLAATAFSLPGASPKGEAPPDRGLVGTVVVLVGDSDGYVPEPDGWDRRTWRFVYRDEDKARRVRDELLSLAHNRAD